jgi:hypothetical protein
LAKNILLEILPHLFRIRGKIGRNAMDYAIDEATDERGFQA